MKKIPSNIKTKEWAVMMVLAYRDFKRSCLKGRRYRSKINQPRLSDSELHQLSQPQVPSSGKIRKYHEQVERLRGRPLSVVDDRDLIGQFAVAKTVERMLQQGDVSHVLNIGASYDMISAYLAPLNETTRFTSMDFPVNLAELNSPLGGGVQKNWVFRSGYVLDLLGSLDERPQLAVFKSVTPLMTPIELSATLQLLWRTPVEYILLCEAWWPRLFGLSNPYRLRKTVTAGQLGNYLHPYPKLASENGYRVESTRFVMASSNQAAPMVELVLRRNTEIGQNSESKNF